MGELSVSGHILSESISGNDLVRNFGRPGGISFVVAWHFLKKQPNGENGFLLTNGTTNIFCDV